MADKFYTVAGQMGCEAGLQDGWFIKLFGESKYFYINCLLYN
jgi:hypothetical protein